MILQSALLAHSFALIPLAVAPSAAPPPAEQPAIQNAQVAITSAAGGLEAAVKAAMARQPGSAWIGWAVPKLPGDAQSCCWNDEGRGCGLEGDRKTPPPRPQGPVKLEGPSHVAVLLRVEATQVIKVRAYGNDCPLDAGGLPFHWLTSVKPTESVALLLRQATATEPAGRRSTADPAIQALALHAGAEAQQALERLGLAATSPSEPTRKSALFWLATTRGRPGYLAVARAAREDPSEKVREHAAFALTQTQDPEALPTLIRLAREDRHPQVRKQAMFWLGQSKDPRATKFFEDLLTR